MIENFEIYTANGQYRKDFIDLCRRELKIALKINTGLTPCQRLVLHILNGELND